MLCIECWGVTSNGITAFATIVMAVATIVSVYLYSKSLRLLVEQNATSDVAVYKERYEMIEDNLGKVNLENMRYDIEVRNFFENQYKKYNTNTEITLIEHKLVNVFSGQNGIKYYSLFKFITQHIKGNQVYREIVKNPDAVPDDFNEIHHILFLVHHWFVSEIILRNQSEIKQYLLDLSKSNISLEQKKHYFNKIKNILLRDYFLVLRLPENDIYIHDGKFKSLFKETGYSDLSNFILELEAKFNSKNN